MSMKSKRGCSLQRSRNNFGYIFVLPFIIGLIVLFIPAVIQSVQLSFSEIIIEGPKDTYQLKNVGWAHYTQLLTVDPTFVRQIIDSLGSLLLNTAIILIYSIFIATLLNRELLGKGIYRAILFLPVIIATGIVSKADAMNVLISSPGSAGIFQAEASTQGIFSSFDLKQFIYAMNLNGDFVDVIVNAVENVNSIITSSGVQVIIFLAGLQSISPSIYESATVEGSTPWQSFWKITIPIISPLMLVNLVYTVVDAFTSYGNPVMDRIYDTIMESANYTLSSAMAIIYFLVAGLALTVAMLFMNHFTFYENR
jgi:ABC-type sugar transport system permease subunit